MVRLPHATLGSATGLALPFAHFRIWTVLEAPKLREVEPGMSVATPWFVPLAALWMYVPPLSTWNVGTDTIEVALSVPPFSTSIDAPLPMTFHAAVVVML